MCPTFLVPPLSPGEGGKKGADYVPNHRGGVFETQIGVESVRRQTATERFRIASASVTLFFTKRFDVQSEELSFTENYDKAGVF